MLLVLKLISNNIWEDATFQNVTQNVMRKNIFAKLNEDFLLQK